MQANLWKLLKVFGNEARIYILRLLLKYEMASLSDIAYALECNYGLKITISGVLKHIKILENAGLIRHESGGVRLDEPDARKTVYLLQGKERIEKIIELGEQIADLLKCGLMFKKTAEIARRIQGIGPGYREERRRLKYWLNQLEKEEIMKNLTEDEKDKVKLWKIIIRYAE